MTSEEFQKVIDDRTEPTLFNAIAGLAGEVYDKWKFKCIDRDDAIQEGAMYCYEWSRLKKHQKIENAQIYFSNVLRCFYERETKPFRNPAKKWDRLKKKYLKSIESMTSEAFKYLKDAIGRNESYAWSWHCNLACAAKDEGVDHATANKIANRFMQIAFKVDTKEPDRGNDDRVDKP